MKKIFILFVAIFFWNCSSDYVLFDFDETTSISESKLNELMTVKYDTVYFQDSLHLVSDALAKLDVKYLSNGLEKVLTKSGREIGITEDLFTYVCNIIDNTNRYKSMYLKKNIKRLAKKAPEGTNNNLNTCNCVGLSIARYLKMDANYVDSVLCVRIPGYSAGNGVALDNFLSAVRLFKPDAAAYASFDLCGADYAYVTGIVALSIGHAVTIDFIGKQFDSFQNKYYYQVLCYDPQINCILRFNIASLDVPSYDYSSSGLAIMMYVK